MQIKFCHPNKGDCLCFTHAVSRALKGEKISAETTDKPVNCSDCFMENLEHSEKINNLFKQTDYNPENRGEV